MERITHLRWKGRLIGDRKGDDGKMDWQAMKRKWVRWKGSGGMEMKGGLMERKWVGWKGRGVMERNWVGWKGSE